jgi:hypothetical protein
MLVIIGTSDYYYESFFLSSLVSRFVSVLKDSVRLILLFGADCIARKPFLAQVGSVPVFSVTERKHVPGNVYFEYKLSLASSIEEIVVCDKITFFYGNVCCFIQV